MLRRRPIPLAGVRTFPKHLRFDRMALMDRGVQRTASAICALVNGSRSWIMSRMSSCCHGSSLGAIPRTTAAAQGTVWDGPLETGRYTCKQGKHHAPPAFRVSQPHRLTQGFGLSCHVSRSRTILSRGTHPSHRQAPFSNNIRSIAAYSLEWLKEPPSSQQALNLQEGSQEVT
jgi:hypothetical protein